jgi:Gpi18-like mannosyltransferase
VSSRGGWERFRARPAELILLAGLVAVAVFLRWAARHELTYDMLVFIRWYHELDDGGRISALDRQIGNYNAPYLYLLMLTTYLPGAVILKIKAVYAVFDALLAFFAYKIVAVHRPGRTAVAAALVVVLLPTVVINASFWGQIDSMWASFTLGSLYFLLRDRQWWAVSSFAVAFAFKPQAIVFLPVLLLCALAGRLRWRTLIAAPAVYLLLDLPAILLGRDPVELLTVYDPGRQSGYAPTALSVHAPSIFAFLPEDAMTDPFYAVDARVATLRTMGYAFTAALVLGIWYVLVARRVPLTPVCLVTIATMFAVLVPYTLPGMHERYFYLGDVLTVVLACYRPRLWYVALLAQVASLGAYTVPLFGWFHEGPSPLMMGLAVVMGTAVVVLVYTVAHDAVTTPARRPPADPRRTG